MIKFNIKSTRSYNLLRAILHFFTLPQFFKFSNHSLIKCLTKTLRGRFKRSVTGPLQQGVIFNDFASVMMIKSSGSLIVRTVGGLIAEEIGRPIRL